MKGCGLELSTKPAVRPNSLEFKTNGPPAVWNYTRIPVSLIPELWNPRSIAVFGKCSFGSGNPWQETSKGTSRIGMSSVSSFICPTITLLCFACISWQIAQGIDLRSDLLLVILRWILAISWPLIGQAVSMHFCRNCSGDRFQVIHSPGLIKFWLHFVEFPLFPNWSDKLLIRLSSNLVIKSLGASSGLINF